MSQEPIPPFRRALHLSALFALAVAQPVFDLFGRGPEFFVAHGSTSGDVLCFGLVPCTLVPLLFYALAWASDLTGATVARALHMLLIAVLSAVLALLALHQLLFGVGALIIAAALGAAVAFLYRRYAPMRSLLSVLAVAPLVVSGVFLLQPGIRRLVAPGAATVVGSASIANPVPVVLVVFDELSGLSLMNESQELDAARWPNFGRLARQSTWFRNATGISFRSELAVPSILTGRYPSRNALPTHEEYPENLFTLLGNRYRVVAFETLTRLCPREICRQIATDSWIDRQRLLWLDAAVAYGHLVLPAKLAGNWLPPLAERWGGFAGSEDDAAGQVDQLLYRGWRKRAGAPAPKVPGAQHVLQMDRAELFDRFLSAIEPSQEPTLYFLHIALPHTPLQYLPSGRKYVGGNDIEANPGGTWKQDEWGVTLSTQRHLLQLGYVDRLVGRLIDRLVETGLYDRALVVVTADHGVASTPGEPRRAPGKTGYPELVAVPLFVKLPKQEASAVSDRNVESVDLVPTIAHAVSTVVPWPVDGVSVFDQGAPRDHKQFLKAFVENEPSWLRLTADMPEKAAILKRQVERFGDGTSRPNGLYAIGAYHALVGQAVPAELPVFPGASVSLIDKGFGGFGSENMVRARIRGSVSGSLEPPVHIAVAVNGTIAAVAQVNGARGGVFTAIVSDELLRPGQNEVRAYLVREEDGVPKLFASANEIHRDLSSDRREPRTGH